MKITKKEFKSYKTIQESGITNMFAVGTVSELSGLSREQIHYIMENYGRLNKEYNEV